MKNTTFLGVAGAYKFDENRDPINSAVILLIKDDKQAYVTTVNP
ncbi:MAG: hypothetical protein WAW16_07935 [Candidatus Cryosericum sp.]